MGTRAHFLPSFLPSSILHDQPKERFFLEANSILDVIEGLGLITRGIKRDPINSLLGHA